MRIDLPQCDFRLCKKYFDGNCIGTEGHREECRAFKNSWVQVSERLPTGTSFVIVSLKNNYVCEAAYIKSKFKYTHGLKYGRLEPVSDNNPVVAWMELPEPPKHSDWSVKE